MRSVQVIKRYQQFTETLQSPDDIAYVDDLAVTHFRGFHEVASIHVQRVSSPDARNVILEIIEDLRNVLAKQNEFG